MNYIIMPNAHQDMMEIFNYISKDNPPAAEKLLSTFSKSMEMLGTHPLVGNIKPNFTGMPVRFWPIKRYFVVYRETIPIEILRVFSAYRDIPELL